MEMSTKKMIHKEVYCGSELEKIQKNNIESINSGYRNLDLELPHGSWPKSCLIEILSREESVSEIILLLPTLKKIVASNKYIVMLSPPHIPYIPTFQSFGIKEKFMLVVNTNRVMEKLWVIEHSIRCNLFGGLLVWIKEPCTFEKLRKVQTLAKRSNGLNFIFRPLEAKKKPSPSPLRMTICSDKYPLLKMNIIKRRGPTKLTPITIDTSTIFSKKNTSKLKPNYDLDCIPPRNRGRNNILKKNT